MSITEIQKRVEVLEAEVSLLKTKAKKKGDAEKPWYKQIPKFGGNAAYEEATKLGKEYRESQRDDVAGRFDLMISEAYARGEPSPLTKSDIDEARLTVKERIAARTIAK